MKKIAVCLPSYNECENIEQLTIKIDSALCLINDKYDCMIINCDNNSPDGTNYIFNSTRTINRKVSIVTNKIGKGVNIYNFFKCCIENDVDYAITIDSDTKNFTSSWLIDILNELENNTDFVYPNYIRRKEEGNTTNHFAVLMLYTVYGKFIRQPIGGDYGFSRRYIEIVLKQKFTKNILKYGIDIFLVVTAIVFNLKMKEVFFGMKKHKPSYSRLDTIFENVVNGFTDTYKQYPMNLKKEKIMYKPRVIKNCRWHYRKYFDKIYKENLKKYGYSDRDYEIIEKIWLTKLSYYSKNILNIKEDFIDELKDYFILRVVSFWDKISLDNNMKWEEIIIKNCIELGGKNGN